MRQFFFRHFTGSGFKIGQFFITEFSDGKIFNSQIFLDRAFFLGGQLFLGCSFFLSGEFFLSRSFFFGGELFLGRSFFFGGQFFLGRSFFFGGQFFLGRSFFFGKVFFLGCSRFFLCRNSFFDQLTNFCAVSAILIGIIASGQAVQCTAKLLQHIGHIDRICLTRRSRCVGDLSALEGSIQDLHAGGV